VKLSGGCLQEVMVAMIDGRIRKNRMVKWPHSGGGCLVEEVTTEVAET